MLKGLTMVGNQTCCECEDRQWATIIRFLALPDIEAEDCVCQVLEELREHNRTTASKNVVLDMAHLERMPSCLLGALVAFRRIIVRDGGAFLIPNCTPQLNDLLRACRLHRVFDLCRTMEELLRRLTTAVRDEPPGRNQK